MTTCLLQKRNGMIDESDLTTAMAMLRYIFRTRPYDHTLMVAEHVVDLARELKALVQLREFNGVGVEHLLLVWADVQRLLTVEPRYKHVSSLIHLSRLAIRRVLLHNDRLPRGIQHLDLPPTMRDYVDLLSDENTVRNRNGSCTFKV